MSFARSNESFRLIPDIPGFPEIDIIAVTFPSAMSDAVTEITPSELSAKSTAERTDNVKSKVNIKVRIRDLFVMLRAFKPFNLDIAIQHILQY